MSGPNEHTDPTEEFIPSHHFTAAWTQLGQDASLTLQKGGDRKP